VTCCSILRRPAAVMPGSTIVNSSRSGARDGVLRPDEGAQPVSDFEQHLVSGGVPEAVVDGLEPVEVKAQDPDLLRGTRTMGQR